MQNDYFEFSYNRKRLLLFTFLAIFSLFGALLAPLLYWKGDTEKIFILIIGFGSVYCVFFSIKNAKRIFNEKKPLIIFDIEGIKILNVENNYNSIYWQNIRGIEFNQNKRESVVTVETFAALTIKHINLNGQIKESVLQLNELDSKSDFIYKLVKNKLETGNFINPTENR